MPLIFGRHGKTCWNELGILQGTLDSPLTTEGKQQARAMGLQARLHQPSMIYSSELPRARESAILANEALELPIFTSTLLNERGFGRLQGELPQEHPKWWQAYTLRYRQDIMGIPGSEAASEVAARIAAFQREMIKQHGDSTILVVGHGEWLKIAKSLACDQPPWSNSAALPGNGELCRLESRSELLRIQQSA